MADRYVTDYKTIPEEKKRIVYYSNKNHLNEVRDLNIGIEEEGL